MTADTFAFGKIIGELQKPGSQNPALK